MELIPAGQHRTSNWAGGTTTELAIFPACASYAARDFQWRLSTALVTAGKSTFTSLPGFHRLLMVLEGEMQLRHEGDHTATLLPFEQDSFFGSRLTECTGTGRDFNLMLAAGWKGSIEAIHLASNDDIAALERPIPSSTEDFTVCVEKHSFSDRTVLGFYCVKEICFFSKQNKRWNLHPVA